MKKILLVLFLFALKLSTNAQMVDSMLKVYSEQFPQQKVYIHSDKDIYRAGDTIWFNASLLAGFRLTNNSKNFYVELIDKEGKIAQRKVYPIIESSAAGFFDIPENSTPSDFYIRGYTTWMLNFDTSYISQKQIQVLDKNGKGPTAKATAAAPTTTNIQFLPEGGNLVNDLESVVAYKADNNFGLPVKAKGNIVNNKGAVVTTFTSEHDGMGTFKLTPVAGETYSAVWTDETGKQQTTPLPAAKNQGVVMHVSAVGKKKVYTLSRTSEVPEDWKSVYIVAQLDHEKIYRAKVLLDNVLFTSGAISTDNLPTGILEITVFSQNWEPLAERIVMVNNNNYMFNAKVNTPEINTNIRAKNTIEVEVPDTLLSNLSIAVTDGGLGQLKNQDNIISRMLLTGDIKGFVYNPTYYFSNTSDSVTNHLDLVMLTHGWRRYNWSDLVKGKTPALKFPQDEYLRLDAKVFGISPASPLRSDEELMAIVVGRDSAKHFLRVPKTGKTEFSTGDAMFFDTIQVYYQFTKDPKLKDRATVMFDNNFYKGPKKIDMLATPWYLQNTDTSILNRTKFLADQIAKFGNKFDGKGNVLQTVTVKTRPKSKLEQLDEKYASGMFKGSDGFSFDFTGDDANYAQDVLTYLQGRVPGLQISTGGGTAAVTWRGSNTSLFLDEMNVDVDQILNIPVADIAYVKVLRPPFMGAIGGGSGGAIAIYTRKGGDVQPTPGKGLNRSLVAGYSLSKQFYSPDYSSRSASSDVVADYRSTLYWEPAIFTGPGRQKVKIEFYNNDITKSYRVILEGINEIGQLVRIEKEVQ